MRLLTRMRAQTAVYWAPTAYDDYGEPSLAAPVELTVRWNDKSEEFVDDAGTQQVSNAAVYVGQDVKLGGKLMLGTLDDLDSTQNPPTDKAWTIQKVMKTPTFRVKKFLRKALV